MLFTSGTLKQVSPVVLSLSLDQPLKLYPSLTGTALISILPPSQIAYNSFSPSVLQRLLTSSQSAYIAFPLAVSDQPLKLYGIFIFFVAQAASSAFRSNVTIPFLI